MYLHYQTLIHHHLYILVNIIQALVDQITILPDDNIPNDDDDNDDDDAILFYYFYRL